MSSYAHEFTTVLTASRMVRGFPEQFTFGKKIGGEMLQLPFFTVFQQAAARVIHISYGVTPPMPRFE